MTILKRMILLLMIPFGVFVVWFGEVDDSPGAMLLGMILVAASVVALISTWSTYKKTDSSRS